MKNLVWLFTGDSITDAGRDRSDAHLLGGGYTKYASENIKSAHGDIDFEFLNYGISGNRTGQLFDRLERNCLCHDPDVISIMIGINDVWHRYHPSELVYTKDTQIEANYRALLETIKERSHAKIIMIMPYILDVDGFDQIKADLEKVKPVIRALADEFADVFIPLDELFDEAMKTQPHPHYYSADGVHPNAEGAKFIGKAYSDAAECLFEKI